MDDVIYNYLQKDNAILDLECGFGKTIFNLVKNGFQNITGIDINESGINVAIEISNKIYISNSNLNLLVGDATISQLQRNSFDFVIMQALLTAIPTKENQFKILRNANHILKPNGFLYIADFGQT